MTIEELAKFDGSNGRAAYVAVGGTIYDVSESSRWQGGQHEEMHRAGQDLTEELKSAPHLRAVIERFPVIGKVENKEQEEPKGIPLLSIIIMAFVALLMIATYML